MSTLYEISLKQEIMLEAYAGILASFEDYLEEHHIDPKKETQNPTVILYRQAIKIHNEILYKSSMKEMIEIEGQFKLFKTILDQLDNHE